MRMRLLERESLVASLRAERAQAEGGHGRIVVVTGAAGAGKTALVRAALEPTDPPGSASSPELAPELATELVTWGYCESSATPRPLGPFRDIGAALWAQSPPRWTALHVSQRLLQQVARPGPVVVVEDAHWIDRASTEVLRLLGRAIADTYALVVVVAREEAAPCAALAPVLGELARSGALVRLEVPPLTDDAVAELTKATGIDLAEAMHLTGGNALLVTQLAAAGEAGLAALSLREAVAARLAGLRPDTRGLAVALSVMPGRVPPAAFAGDDWDHVDHLVAAGLLAVAPDGVEFRHELVRLAIADAIRPGRRRALHAQALQRLTSAGNADPARLAHHARECGHGELALSTGIEAARRAAAFGAHRQAAAHYRRAVADAQVHAGMSDQIRLLIALALEENAIGRDEHARRAAEQALRTAIALGDPALHCAAARIASRMEPREERAHQLAQVCLELCERHEVDDELPAAYATLAHNRMLARAHLDAIGYARHALELPRAADDIDSEIIACAALGAAQLSGGDADGAAMLRRAIYLADAYGNEPEVARGYADLVSSAGQARQYACGAAATREAMAYFTGRDLDGFGNHVRAWQARCLFEQGRWVEAEAELSGLDEPGVTLTASTTLMVYDLHARLDIRRGSGTPASWLRQADEIASTTGALPCVAPVLAAQAEAQWLAGQPVPVERLRAMYELAGLRSDAWVIGELGLWLWRAGELDALPAAAATPFRLHVEGELRAAAQAWHGVGCPYEAGDALADSDVVGELREALEIFAGLGALAAWQRAAHRLRSLGVRSIPRRPDLGRVPAATDNLTTREAEVLGWLVKGHSDAEIAALLQLSVRTVEHHVAAILHKKHVNRRRDLPV